MTNTACRQALSAGATAGLALLAAIAYATRALWIATPVMLVAVALAVIVVVQARFARLLRPLVTALELEEKTRVRSATEIVDAAAARLLELKHRSAQTNPITRLPTREHLLAAIDSDLAGGAQGLLGLLHLCDFDQMLAFDEGAAREALALFGERLTRAVGERHLLVQVDRATFAVWLQSSDAPEAFAALVYVADQQLPLGAGPLTPTIGHAAATSPDGGASAERLLARATADLPGVMPDRARRGAGDLNEDRERFALEQELARAIEREQLSIVFQPVVDTAAGHLVGAEALLRWSHPGFGSVSPARFIPVVERLGLSDRYGLWVLNAACREAARWRAEGLVDLRMAVNLSASQVGDPDLEAKIDRTLRRHGLPTRAIELELTETAAMADAERTKALFTRLRAKGLGLAIDDFGAGYSSLSYLKNLPFTKLKIDREFVTDVDTRRGSRAICKALLELGRGLDLTVLAEGVETQAEVDALRNLGCRVFQGFHFSRPLGPDAFLDFARSSSWRAVAATLARSPSLA